MTMYGPQAALIAEAFTPRLRYIAGGPAPFIATWLFASYHSTIPISIYIVICAVISIVSSYLPTDYTNKDTSLEAQYGKG
jgi:hypothetical protein